MFYFVFDDLSDDSKGGLQKSFHKVIFAKSFYGINQKIQTKKAYFQNLSWFQFHIFKLCVIMCVSLFP